MIRPCAFINFLIFFHPVRLLSPVRLLGTPEYVVSNQGQIIHTYFNISNEMTDDLHILSRIPSNENDDQEDRLHSAVKCSIK